MQKEKLSILEKGLICLAKYRIIEKKKLTKDEIIKKQKNTDFNVRKIQDIDIRLHERVYFRAGQLNVSNIKEGNRHAKSFEAKRLLSIKLYEMRNNVQKSTTYEEVLRKVKHYYNELILMKPFKIGNVRVITEFIRQYIKFLSSTMQIEGLEYEKIKKDLNLDIIWYKELDVKPDFFEEKELDTPKLKVKCMR